MLTGTTLVGPIAPGDTLIRVASATGFVKGQTAQIDAEQVRLDAQNMDAPEWWTVTRGINGTDARAHATGAAVVTGDAQAWPQPERPAPSVYSYGAQTPIQALPGIHELNTGAATVFSLPAPALSQDGLVLIITAKTAHAYEVHTPTAFLGVDPSEDEAVFGGAIGNNFAIVAQNGRWLVLSAANVTFST